MNRIKKWISFIGRKLALFVRNTLVFYFFAFVAFGKDPIFAGIFVLVIYAIILISVIGGYLFCFIAASGFYLISTKIEEISFKRWHKKEMKKREMENSEVKTNES